jgi:hypothetical protein
MPRKDVLHDVVKRALVKDGWSITHDPLRVEFGGLEFYIDLGAEELLGAQKDGRKIAVEVKSFIAASTLSEFHTAVGQFVNYRLVLTETEPERTLYLAVPEVIYASLLDTTFGRLAMQAHQLKIVVFDEQQEVIVQWIE